MAPRAKAAAEDEGAEESAPAAPFDWDAHIAEAQAEQEALAEAGAAKLAEAEAATSESG